MEKVAPNKFMESVYRTLLILFFAASVNFTFSQSKPILEKEVSISFFNEKLDVALAKLARQEKFTFSYNPAILDLNSTILVSYDGKTLREIIIALVGPNIQIKVIRS